MEERTDSVSVIVQWRQKIVVFTHQIFMNFKSSPHTQGSDLMKATQSHVIRHTKWDWAVLGELWFSPVVCDRGRNVCNDVM